MADRDHFDPIGLLLILMIAYWATFGGGCDDIQPKRHDLGEVIHG